MAPRWLERLIERRFGGYVHAFNQPDPSAPRQLEGAQRRVAVIGGGLAGIAAADALAGRGFEVVIFEKADYLGGKIGAWTVDLGGYEAGVEHGFHAFFKHYHNLNRFLERVGISQSFEAIEDYQILTCDGGSYSFAGVETAPILNLLSLARHGIYSLGEVARSRAGQEMDIFLRYEPDRIFRDFDDLPFSVFAERAELPASLRLIFNTFSRAFFAEEDRISTAELIKSFHFYYLSHDAGLLYDYPADDYERCLIGPIRAHLEGLGVDLRLGRPVAGIERTDAGFAIDGEPFDAAVIAADVVGTRAIAGGSPWLADADPELARRLEALRAGQRYAVLRVWMDRDVREGLPGFVITDRFRVLDAITLYHRISKDSAERAAAEGGGIYELHSYAVPDDVPDEQVRDLLVAELVRHLPELEGAEVRREYLQINKNFPAFHVGMAANRPGFQTAVPGLYLAGDWVALPLPAMLMEAAWTSGLLCANALLAAEGLQEEPVFSVPPEGILAGLPEMPKRRQITQA